MQKIIDFVPLLSMIQEHISSRYAAALSDSSKLPQLRSYIEKYLRDGGYVVEGLTQTELSNKLYSEMAEYSILTKYLGRDNIEEININAWNDIAITYTSGRTIKAKEHFYSPSHAVDIVKRLLHHSGMIIDNSTPMSQGHLPNNTRITALKEPLVDDEVGVSVSIRLLHPSRINRKQIISSGNATEKMIDFLTEHGMESVVERGDRAFPASHLASDVVDALLRAAEGAGAEVLCGKEVRDILRCAQGYEVRCADGSGYSCKKLIICTGGLSYPKTGSTGDGYKWATQMGHTIKTLFPSLTAIVPKGYKITEVSKGHIDRSTPCSEIGGILCGNQRIQRCRRVHGICRVYALNHQSIAH